MGYKGYKMKKPSKINALRHVKAGYKTGYRRVTYGLQSKIL